MKNRLILTLGILVAAILVIYMFTFVVRYDQVAVVTTFGRATAPQYLPDGSIDPANSGSVRLTPGLGFKWPPPVQQVHQYSNQIQVLDDVMGEQQTVDNYSVILRTYITWRITDPLRFHTSLLGSIDQAQETLRPIMREAASNIGRYRFDQLVNNDPNRLQLTQLETEALQFIQTRLADLDRGIQVEHFGIRRLVLPEPVTEKVFERMKATRERLAQDARSTGRARAEAIKSEAESARDRILTFAANRAEAIRAVGIKEAAQYYEVFGRTPEAERFAIFLRELEAIRQIFRHRTTFVLDASFGPLRYFAEPPGVEEPPSPGRMTGEAIPASGDQR